MIRSENLLSTLQKQYQIQEKTKQVLKIAKVIGMSEKELQELLDSFETIKNPEPLQPHQKRLIYKLLSNFQPGIIAAHSMGSGKTRASIEAYKALRLPTTVIVPASLKANYVKELKRWLGGIPPDMDIVSQQEVARKGIEPYDKPGGLLIIDEAHKAREATSKLLQALSQSRAKKKLLLSGTPLYNSPADLATLVNFVAGKKLLPETKKEFESQFIQYKKINPSFWGRLLNLPSGYVPELVNTSQLARILHRYVDYFPPRKEGYPVHEEQTITVPMGKQQTDIYKTIMGKAPLWVRWKVKAGLPPNRKELEAMRAFLTGARQVSNTTEGFIKNPIGESPKIEKAFKFFKSQLEKNPRFKALIYSNYITSGLEPYKRLLQQHNIPFGEFSGNVPPEIRNKLVKDYNTNKLKALLISSAGAEGLDLKGTRLVQILEPHFNEEKEKQIMGRAIRYKSHANLPPEEQHVLVQRFLAQPRANWFQRLFGKEVDRGTDEYIRNIALQKRLLADKIIEILKNQ